VEYLVPLDIGDVPSGVLWCIIGGYGLVGESSILSD
jgi:hypothetical protein